MSLDHRAIARRLARAERAITVHYSRVTTSTQEDARTLLETHRPPFVVVTDAQTAGRGRLDRSWTTPLGAAVLMTLALERPLSSETLGAVPLIAGVAVTDVLERAGAAVRLKWPNDVIAIVDGRVRKLGGIIAELTADAVLVGIGINADVAVPDLPTDDAISLRQLGVGVDRAELVAGITEGVLGRVSSGLSIDDYRIRCATIGTRVRVARIDGTAVEGVAMSVDVDGTLLVSTDDDVIRITAGDVQHLRPHMEG